MGVVEGGGEDIAGVGGIEGEEARLGCGVSESCS
jgi:hypothetical protein